MVIEPIDFEEVNIEPIDEVIDKAPKQVKSQIPRDIGSVTDRSN